MTVEDYFFIFLSVSIVWGYRLYLYSKDRRTGKETVSDIFIGTIIVLVLWKIVFMVPGP